MTSPPYIFDLMFVCLCVCVFLKYLCQCVVCDACSINITIGMFSVEILMPAYLVWFACGLAKINAYCSVNPSFNMCQTYFYF